MRKKKLRFTSGIFLTLVGNNTIIKITVDICKDVKTINKENALPWRHKKQSIN